MNKRYYIILLLALVLGISSCRKFVEIDPPATDLIKSTVFTSDATANSAIAALYAGMAASGYASGNSSSISYMCGLSADDLTLYNTNNVYVEFATTSLTSTNVTITSFWSRLYQDIFRANSIIEGLATSVNLSPGLKTRIEGEAKFIRAFAHFYLVNLYGDVPLILTTDYKINSSVKKTSKALVYQQIINDLKAAKLLLSENYLTANGTTGAERARVNKFAAAALLARVYLYTEDWQNAELEASSVIGYTSLYGPELMNNMFLKNSREAIWQLSNDTRNSWDATTFVMSATAVTPVNAAIAQNFYSSFDPIDQRKLNWIGTRITTAGTFRYASKYKVTSATPVTEYSMVLRLGEQYLIRAEARAHQPGKIKGSNSAESDLNFIRNRAGLGNTLATEATMLNAIEQERRFELFTEWGHRWFDLKRTGKINEVMPLIKGTNWQLTDQLYPIPKSEIIGNPSLSDAQNPGYE